MSRTVPAPQAHDQRAPRLDPRAPFVVDTRELGRRPGTMRELHRTVEAPAGGFMLETVGVAAGAPVTLDLRLEAVMEGVLVSGTAYAPLAGECGRCLEPVGGEVEVDLQELYVYADEDADEDAGRLVGDLIDIEPAVRDAIVLALPVTPLCDEDCPGLCPECGTRLADAEPDHGHETIDPRWAALSALSNQHPTETNQEN